MDATEIRQRLCNFINTAEDKKIEAIYTLLEDSLNDTDLNEHHKSVLDKRRQNYEQGIGKSFTWDETVLMAKEAFAKTSV